MKAGQLKKVADAYAPFFPAPWKRIGNAFRRRVGESWVQAISFNPSRFDDNYIPRVCCEFLKAPGPALCGFLTQELQTANGVQRWISAREHERGIKPIAAEMLIQFRPQIDAEVSESDVRKELEAKKSYWPHVYALAVLAAERRDRDEALLDLKFLRKLNETKKSAYIEEAAKRVEHLIEVIDSRDVVQRDLQAAMREKLAGLRMD